MPPTNLNHPLGSKTAASTPLKIIQSLTAFIVGVSISTYAQELKLPEQWEYSAPLIEAEERAVDPSHSKGPDDCASRWNMEHVHEKRLVIDPASLQMLFQGMLQKDKSGNGYGRFDWRLGLLTPVPN